MNKFLAENFHKSVILEMDNIIIDNKNLGQKYFEDVQ